MASNLIAVKYRHVTGRNGTDKTSAQWLQICTLPIMHSASHCMIDNCEADWALIYRQVLRPCNYVHIIITDEVVLGEVSEVRQKMFLFDWRVRQRVESGKKSWISHQSVQRNVNGEMAQSGLKLKLWFDCKCMLFFLLNWLLMTIRGRVGSVRNIYSVVSCLRESVLFMMSWDGDQVLL